MNEFLSFGSSPYFISKVTTLAKKSFSPRVLLTSLLLRYYVEADILIQYF